MKQFFKKAGVTIAIAIMLIVGGVVAAAPASAAMGRLDNWSGKTILMNYGWASESVPSGSWGWSVQSFRIPTYSCVRLTYRDGSWRNYNTTGSYVWIYPKSMDGYLSRC